MTDREKAWESYCVFKKFNSFGEPTYKFEIGDKVRVGNLVDCVIEEVKEDEGVIIYGYSHEARKNVNKNATGREFSYSPWYRVRPIVENKTQKVFTKENDIDIRFSNSTIESLLNKFYLHGVDMSPEYQRDYVWDEKDKEALLDSIFSHIEIGKFAFVNRSFEYDMPYEILDGKQRLSTLLDFYENRLAYRGVYFNDLVAEDKYTFMNTNVTIGETSNLSKEQIYRYFYTLNRCGKVMDEEHLEKIKENIENTDVSLIKQKNYCDNTY